MYEEHYGLTERPFSITPDPRFLYMSEKHREALAHLLYGLESEGGFVLLTGEVGSGKTTLCRYLLDQIPEECVVAFVINPRVTVLELLSTICDEFRIKYPERNQSVKVFVDRINAFLLDIHANGRKAVLIIDEAQNLSRSVLEQIRLLTNLETSKRKLLQIILLGQPELRDRLARPDLRQLGQRIIARYHLGSLTRKEVKRYISHRLAVAGTRNELFTAGALDEIYSRSRGVPRLVNVICDRALLGTYSLGKRQVDRRTVWRAAREVLGDAVRRPKRTGTPNWYPAVMAFCVVVFMSAVLYHLGLLPGTLVPGAPQALTDQTAESVMHRKPIPAQGGDAAASAPSVVMAKEDTTPPPPLPASSGTPPASQEAAPAPATPAAEAEAPSAVQPEKPAVAATETPDPPKDPAAPVAEAPAPSPSEKLAGLARSQGQDAAYGTLFEKWGLTYTAGGGRDQACRQVGAEKVRCFTGRGGWEELRRWNRPAVVTLTDDRGESYQAALIGVDEHTAYFTAAGENLQIGLDDVRSRIQGEFFILWPVPAGYRGDLHKGQQGPKVAWLEFLLARARGEAAQPVPTARYGDSVVQAVKEYQEANGLKPDGIIGPATLNRLMTVAKPDAPVLTRIPKGS